MENFEDFGTAGTGTGRKRKSKRDPHAMRKAPHAPKRFKSSYICFFMAKQAEIKEALGSEATVSLISKRSAEMWYVIMQQPKNDGLLYCSSQVHLTYCPLLILTGRISQPTNERTGTKLLPRIRNGTWRKNLRTPAPGKSLGSVPRRTPALRRFVYMPITSRHWCKIHASISLCTTLFHF